MPASSGYSPNCLFACDNARAIRERSQRLHHHCSKTIEAAKDIRAHAGRLLRENQEIKRKFFHAQMKQKALNGLELRGNAFMKHH